MELRRVCVYCSSASSREETVEKEIRYFGRALAERGIDRSSVGAAAQGDLYGDMTNAKAGIASDARSASDTLRSNVENTKSNLYAMNSASADPAAANAMALGQSKSLVAPPQYSPIGDVFASAATCQPEM